MPSSIPREAAAPSRNAWVTLLGSGAGKAEQNFMLMIVTQKCQRVRRVFEAAQEAR